MKQLITLSKKLLQSEGILYLIFGGLTTLVYMVTRLLLSAFAIDAGLGGIMIWHMNCDLPYDNELSLFRAIKDTKTDKSAM